MSATSPLVGVIGGGQLGRLLAQAGARMNVRVRVLDPNPACAAASVADVIEGAYDDAAALDLLADGCDAITYEFENVPAGPAEALAGRLGDRVPVRPAPIALRTAQDRLREREMFETLGIDAPAFASVESLGEVRDAIECLGAPALLKARRLGYDGKGQALISSTDDAERAWDAIGRAPALLDRFVPFEREVSVVAVRGADGSFAAWPLTENVHRGGILRLSRAPASGVPDAVARDALQGARRVGEHLGYVGVFAVEYFQLGSGESARLLANEIAPRVHNSGHWTIEGAQTSQFENHLRAVLGMPLGATDPVGHSAMVNCIGELPRPGAVESSPGATLHDYEKAPRPGRKVGHVTITAEMRAELDERLERYTRVVG